MKKSQEIRFCICCAKVVSELSEREFQAWAKILCHYAHKKKPVWVLHTDPGEKIIDRLEFLDLLISTEAYFSDQEKYMVVKPHGLLREGEDFKVCLNSLKGPTH